MTRQRRRAAPSRRQRRAGESVHFVGPRRNEVEAIRLVDDDVGAVLEPAPAWCDEPRPGQRRSLRASDSSKQTCCPSGRTSSSTRRTADS